MPRLSAGVIALDSAQARHARGVLRLEDGAAVEVFDDHGAIGLGTLIHDGARDAAVRVQRADAAAVEGLQWSVASAVPKGERADWMVEKLSELGTAAFIPLSAARSVVLPQGTGKRERWRRIATEAAKQSRRPGVMRIDELTGVESAVKSLGDRKRGDDLSAAVNQAHARTSAGWFLSTEVGGIAIGQAIAALGDTACLTLFIGPEGGWTAQEIELFVAAGLTAVRLTHTILRVETAAVAAAAVLATRES